jgi:hypothetical protein
VFRLRFTPSALLSKIGKPLPAERNGREIAIATVLSDRRMGDEANSNANNTLSSLLCIFFSGLNSDKERTVQSYSFPVQVQQSSD